MYRWHLIVCVGGIRTSVDSVGDGHEIEPCASGPAVGARAVGTAHSRPAVRISLASLHFEQELA